MNEEDSVDQDKNSGNQSQVHSSSGDELSPRPALERRPYPKVMIECPHLLIVSLGAQKSCSMCGSVWGGSPYPANWEERVNEAAAYQEMKWWRKIVFTLTGR